LNKTPKICILIPYFGKWPDWINFFLLSCKTNDSFDWQFFTDCGLPDICSDNVIFHQTTINEFSKLASLRLGIELSIQHPYKLCDFKPAYGIILKEYLVGYDFWGYGDIDLIYGNLQKFITTKILFEYDVISFHPNFIPGHLCLLKNNEIVNQLFRKSPIWESVLADNKMYSFTEIYNKKGLKVKPDAINVINKRTIYYDLIMSYIINKALIQRFLDWTKSPNRSSLDKKNDLKDFSSIVRFSEDNHLISVIRIHKYVDDIGLIKSRVKRWQITWRNGNLYYGDKEIIYFHFQLHKYSKKMVFIDNMKKSNSFEICKKK